MNLDLICNDCKKEFPLIKGINPVKIFFNDRYLCGDCYIDATQNLMQEEFIKHERRCINNKI
jgi:hypothetical protein|tara:strand:- start:1067 stop:1252 length:186 start_codon:yes stop_codon:yes gene_type:complete